MDCIPQLRQRRWLAFVALALCLPWLVTVGSGYCALRADSALASSVAQTPPDSDCCQHCCPTTGNVQPTTPAPPPAEAAFCCEAFKVCLPLGAGASGKIKWLTARGHAPDGAALLVLFSLALNRAASPDARHDFGLPGPTPPGAFLRTVARRCFPSNAPPVPAALLS